jgi:cation:H+ antiporter
MTGLSTPILLAVFVLASVATWIARVVLSGTTDELDNRLGLGAALGGHDPARDRRQPARDRSR